jgi:hypothetical protein
MDRQASQRGAEGSARQCVRGLHDGKELSGDFESHLNVIPSAAGRFLIVTGSAHPVRDTEWIGRRIVAGEQTALCDVGAMFSVAVADGPERVRPARALVTMICRRPRQSFSRAREIDLAHARVRATRKNYSDLRAGL